MNQLVKQTDKNLNEIKEKEIVIHIGHTCLLHMDIFMYLFLRQDFLLPRVASLKAKIHTQLVMLCGSRAEVVNI